jgi:DNA modification methylase
MRADASYNRVIDVISQDIWGRMFPPHRKLLPHLDDSYEIELAYYENLLLTDGQLRDTGAYFASVNGQYTRHFLMCVGDSVKLPDSSSIRLRSFFKKNLFRTGYGTHGLFPYRGKFHPQMIKGIINVMGLQRGETVLDPMMGSGTVLIEASLMRINSIGFDTSPFCRFMTQTKIDALTMSLSRSQNALANYKEVYDYFRKLRGKPRPENKYHNGFIYSKEQISGDPLNQDRSNLISEDRESSETHNFLLLAYLDSVGYFERSKRQLPVVQFKTVLERYVFVIEKCQRALRDSDFSLGKSKALIGDARSLDVEDQSIDGIIFSPPYSFAIDYIDNDMSHLRYFDVDLEPLRKSTIGLRGSNLQEKFNLYLQDMNMVIAECYRVLRPGRICTIIIGTNDNQLSKVIGVKPESVNGLHELVGEQAVRHGFKIIKTLSRPIIGIANTMRREYILFLGRE